MPCWRTPLLPKAKTQVAVSAAFAADEPGTTREVLLHHATAGLCPGLEPKPVCSMWE